MAIELALHRRFGAILVNEILTSFMDAQRQSTSHNLISDEFTRFSHGVFSSFILCCERLMSRHFMKVYGMKKGVFRIALLYDYEE